MQITLDDQINTPSHELPYLNRDGLFGDGFFTTGIIQAHLFVHQDRHLQRLKVSAETLLFKNLDFNYLKEVLQQIVHRTVDACIRITIFRRQQLRGYAISAEAEAVCHINLSLCPTIPKQNCELIDSPVSISSNPTLAGIKHLNRLDSVLASTQLLHVNQEALMYMGELVICGSKSNLFVKLNGVWLTPLLDQCGINGITRTRALEIFETNKIQVIETQIKRADLVNIEAAFVTNSLIGLWPAKSINGRKLDINTVKGLQRLISRV